MLVTSVGRSGGKETNQPNTSGRAFISKQLFKRLSQYRKIRIFLFIGGNVQAKHRERQG